MKRKTQTEVFNSDFPHVDIKSTQGMLIFQGYLAGYAKRKEESINNYNSFRKRISTLEKEIEALLEHNKNLGVLVKTQDLWQKSGGEH